MSESSWTQVRLGDVAEIVMGQAPSGDTVSETGSGVPFLQGNAEFGPIHPHAQFICSRPARQCNPGDILISVRAPVGALNLADHRYAIGRGLAAIRFKRIDPDYGRYALQRGILQLAKVAQGSTFEAVGRHEISNVKISVPTAMCEQRRIAEGLASIEDKISISSEIVNKLDVMGGSIRRHILLNNNWPTARMHDLCSEITVGIVVRPTQYYTDSGIPVLRSLNVRPQGIDLADVRYMSPASHRILSKSAVKPGDVVTVRTGYPGLSAVIPSSLPEANCVDIIISRPGVRMTPEYLCYWINSEQGKGQVLRGQGGLAQQHFNVGEMNKLEVKVPPVDDQRAIADILASHESRLSLEKQEVAKLKSLYHGLRDDLVAGRMRIGGQKLEHMGAG